jgi:hypothetical protein
MSAMPGIPRHWWTIGVPGVLERRHATYWPLPLDAMPPVGRTFNGTLDWLLDTEAHNWSLQRGPDDPAERDANAAGLHAIAPGLSSPPAFRLFIEDPEPRRHIRSATACYLDLAHFAIPVSDGGVLVHFLSDQQWVLHWLLYLGPDGSEAVVVCGNPLGFDDGESEPLRLVNLSDAQDWLAVCSETFEEFLYRLWIENDLFHRLAVDETPLEALPPELRAYAMAYPRDLTQPPES